ncbi:MAG: hypothetical protein AAGC67_08910 [Myxococcota bacterium]
MTGPAPIRSRRIVVLLVGSALLLSGCTRLGPPRPEVAYQADVRIEVVLADGERLPVEQLTEFYAAGRRRRQVTVEGVDVVVIDRPDLRVSWLLDPEARAFDEYWLKSRELDRFVPPDPFGPRAGGRYREAGVDEIHGVRVRRFEIEGDRVSGLAWISRDGVPVRFEGEVGLHSVRVEYGEVQRGRLAAYLFAIPPTYAGYEDRKQRASEKRDDGIERAVRKLRAEREWRPTHLR